MKHKAMCNAGWLSHIINISNKTVKTKRGNSKGKDPKYQSELKKKETKLIY